jgi:hypothetical protein
MHSVSIAKVYDLPRSDSSVLFRIENHGNARSIGFDLPLQRWNVMTIMVFLFGCIVSVLAGAYGCGCWRTTPDLAVCKCRF